MSIFTIVPLNTLCDDVIDCPHSTPIWRNEGIFVVRNYNIVDGSLNFSNASYVDENTYAERIRRGKPEPGDLIISREAPMGVVCIVPDGVQCCLGQRLVLIKVNKAICDPAYLHFVLQSQFVQSQIKAVDKTGSIVSNLNIPDLKALKIPFIEKSIQKKIGVILSAIIDKINLNNSISAELEKTAKLLYDYWFVQFDFPNSEGNPYRASGGQMVYNEQLKRDIPINWVVNQIGNEDKVVFKRGYSYSSKEISSGEGIPMINLASISRKQEYIPSGIKFVNGQISDDCTVRPFEMLIACTDLTRKAEIIGCPIIVPTEYEKYAFSMDLAKIIIKTKDLTESYLYRTLRTKFYHKYVKGYATGTNVIHLDLDGVRWYYMTIPPLELQLAYDRIHMPLISKQAILLNENKELTALRDFLLPLLMNGQVRVE